MLDRLRLGKQRAEARTCLRVMTNLDRGWKGHPCVGMWKGHPDWLAEYIFAVCREWVVRGYQDTVQGKVNADIRLLRELGRFPRSRSPKPWWLGDERVHDSHKSQLIQKEPDRYRAIWPDVPDDLQYFWPRMTAIVR